MKYRKMGSLDWEVSALGFGAMRMPTKRLNRLAVDEAEAIRIVRHGIDLGINYVDTAWFYHAGESEKILGRALKDGYRERVHLTTKLPTPLARKPEDFDKYLHAQLKRLQTDYLDCYLLHTLDRGGFEKSQRLGFIEQMVRAREDGLIRHIGFSFHDTLPVFKEIIDAFDWDIAQIQYNYMDTCVQATTEGLEYAHGKGIAVVVMEPLKGGSLATPPAEALEVMRASGVDRTPVDWALQFLWNRPEVACVLSGMGSQRMVDENCASADRSGVGTLTMLRSWVLDQTDRKLETIARSDLSSYFSDETVSRSDLRSDPSEDVFIALFDRSGSFYAHNWSMHESAELPRVAARRSHPGVVARRLLDEIYVDVALAAPDDLQPSLQDALRRAAPSLAKAVG